MLIDRLNLSRIFCKKPITQKTGLTLTLSCDIIKAYGWETKPKTKDKYPNLLSDSLLSNWLSKLSEDMERQPRLNARMEALKKELAEKNRDLEIEAALEKVRSKTMAMHSSSDVAVTVATMFDEFV